MRRSRRARSPSYARSSCSCTSLAYSRQVVSAPALLLSQYQLRDLFAWPSAWRIEAVEVGESGVVLAGGFEWPVHGALGERRPRLELSGRREG